VLAGHCAETGRTVRLSHLTTALIGRDTTELDALVTRHRPRGMDPARFVAQVSAGTTEDQIGRFRELAEAGVGEIVVRLPDLVDARPLERMASVIEAFRA
jgi:hypothetical protein